MAKIMASWALVAHAMIANFRLAWRLLRRDARAGELRVLAAALVIAVASVASVAFFTDRVKAGLSAQADKLLGADLILSGDRPLPTEFAQQARRQGLALVDSIRFNSMVLSSVPNILPVLSEVKAVGAGYPLRGEVLLVDSAQADGRAAQGIPPPGTVLSVRSSGDQRVPPALIGAAAGHGVDRSTPGGARGAWCWRHVDAGAGAFARGGHRAAGARGEREFHGAGSQAHHEQRRRRGYAAAATR